MDTKKNLTSDSIIKVLVLKMQTTYIGALPLPEGHLRDADCHEYLHVDGDHIVGKVKWIEY